MAKYASKRIGILGGTFNPPHNGHLYIAAEAKKKLSLDKVIFVPAYSPPHKGISGKVSARARLKMLRLATAGKSGFSVSDYEIRRKGKSYTIRTAGYFRRKYGKGTVLFFVIGADMVRGLGRWKDIGKLRKSVRFAVFPRPGFKIRKKAGPFTMLKAEARNVSSTEIRQRLRKGGSIPGLVPTSVERYIAEKGLYRI